jgi:hypothetical protein
LVQRRQVDLDGVEPEKQVLAESPAATSARRSALVAARTRTSTFRVFESPTRSSSPLWSTRSRRACWPSVRLAIVEEEGSSIGHFEAPGAVRARR